MAAFTVIQLSVCQVPISQLTCNFFSSSHSPTASSWSPVLGRMSPPPLLVLLFIRSTNGLSKRHRRPPRHVALSIPIPSQEGRKEERMKEGTKRPGEAAVGAAWRDHWSTSLIRRRRGGISVACFSMGVPKIIST